MPISNNCLEIRFNYLNFVRPNCRWVNIPLVSTSKYESEFQIISTNNYMTVTFKRQMKIVFTSNLDWKLHFGKEIVTFQRKARF